MNLKAHRKLDDIVTILSLNFIFVQSTSKYKALVLDQSHSWSSVQTVLFSAVAALDPMALDTMDVVAEACKEMLCNSPLQVKQAVMTADLLTIGPS